MKPLLSAKAPDDLSTLRYPLFASPKIDGIRCLTTEAGPVTRALKPIPNYHIRHTLETFVPAGLDGELWIPGAANFGEVSSAIMREDEEPSFLYLVFDDWSTPDLPYTRRLSILTRLLENADQSVIRIVPQTLVHCPEDIFTLEQVWLAKGYEGVMLRDPDGRYKHGRSTVREQILLKLKRFEDSEAEIIGVEEEMHNGNEAVMNALGYTERSSHKANKTGKGRLGALICRTPEGVEFKIGTGFTAAERETLWAWIDVLSKEAAAGRWVVKYRHQPHGTKEVPRFPSFLGIRFKEDMSCEDTSE